MPDEYDLEQRIDPLPADEFDAGLIAGFGPPTTPGDFSQPPGLPDPNGGSDPVVLPLSPAAPLPGADRYQFLGELARGGMGVVLRARDPDLGRDLAVKVLRGELASRPAVVRRFVEEAQVGGQLQHPGCVPVYELGAFADGRPYFTMKLVKGRTLAALLDERRSPADDLPRFVAIFEQVCQAVAYAHSKRVIHRDLKPQNVMVGAFGEVQVMDWGLAKVLRRAGAADGARADAGCERSGGGPAEIHTVRSGSADPDTEAGSVAGTPAFMPPEQAAGEVGRVDERADVFGLGAILCVILTGQPPYTGRDPDEVRRKAVRGDLAECLSRLGDCGADPELTGLAKRCLAAGPADRPRDAGAVAASVSAYRQGVEGRARRAELERAAAEARAAEERHRRRWQAAVAAVALLALAAGGALAWWLAGRRADADRMVELALAESQGYLDRAGGARSVDELMLSGREAEAAAARAVKLAEGGFASAAARRRAAAAQAAAAEALAAAERDAALLDRLLNVTIAWTRSGTGPTVEELYADAFRAWGLNVDTTEPAAAAALLAGRPAVVRSAAAAGLDEWAAELRRAGRPRADWRRLFDLAAAVDDHPERRELRALFGSDRLLPERAAGELSQALLPLGSLAGLFPGEGRRRLRELARQPGAVAGPALGVLLLARALREAGDPDAAERLLRTAVTTRPGEPALLIELGSLLEWQRPPRRAEAVECYRAARAARPVLGVSLARALAQTGRAEEGLAVLAELVRARPDHPDMHVHLGLALGETGRTAEAEAAYREALRLRPDDPFIINSIGVALLDQGRDAEAERAFREVVRRKPGAAFGHANLGAALVRLRRPQEAEAACREALRLDPDQPDAHLNLAGALMEQRKPARAEAEAREAVRLRPDFAGGYVTLGRALLAQGRPAEAADALRAALHRRPGDPDVWLYLGEALLDQGRPDEAGAAAREVLRLKPDHADARTLLGSVWLHQGRFPEAEAAYREALRLKPHSPAAHHNLGTALFNQGRFPEAEAALREALRLKPAIPEAHYLLGHIFGRQGHWPEAEAAFREALRLRPGYAEVLMPLGAVLGKLGRFAEAETALRQAVRLRPGDAHAHCNLGSALLDQGRFADALAELRRGHELGSSQPGWSEPSAQWVQRCERLLALDRRLPAALAGLAPPASTRERLELAELCLGYKRRYAAAAGFYAAAFAADPGLAERPNGHRYNAARAAARAGCGQGEDAAGLTGSDRARLRRQALDWLRTDLAAWQKRARDPANREQARQALARWQADAALAAVRDPAALAGLLRSEQQEWRQLWAEVAEALRPAGK
jgi:serine/threonine-protein kinase